MSRILDIIAAGWGRLYLVPAIDEDQYQMILMVNPLEEEWPNGWVVAPLPSGAILYRQNQFGLYDIIKYDPENQNGYRKLAWLTPTTEKLTWLVGGPPIRKQSRWYQTLMLLRSWSITPSAILMRMKLPKWLNYWELSSQTTKWRYWMKDKRGITILRGRGMVHDDDGVYVEPSKPMKRLVRKRELGPDDYQAMRLISDALNAFGWSIRLVKPSEKGRTEVSQRVTKTPAVVEANDGKAPLISTDYLWMMENMGFGDASSLATYLLNIIHRSINF